MKGYTAIIKQLVFAEISQFSHSITKKQLQTPAEQKQQ